MADEEAEQLGGTMEEKTVPYVVYEGTMARFERVVKRLTILLIIVITVLFASNIAWLYVWNQYDVSAVVVDSEDGGNANYLEAGMSGVINNAESDSNKTEKEK